MRIEYPTLPAIALLLLLYSCTGQQNAQSQASLRIDSIDISEVVVELPEAPGKELVLQSCVPCHSLRYIEMQPDMTKTAWTKIVTKMIKNFGAPVRDSLTAAAIVDYLVAIKGKK